MRCLVSVHERPYSRPLCRYYAEAKWMDGMSTAVDRCALRAVAIARRQEHLAQEAEQAKTVVSLTVSPISSGHSLPDVGV